MGDNNCLRINYKQVYDGMGENGLSFRVDKYIDGPKYLVTNIECGRGAYKTVYLAMKTGVDQLVVWSELNETQMSQLNVNRTRNEIKIGLLINRSNDNNKFKNLVKTIGAGKTDKGIVVIIQEFMNNGTLSDLIIEKAKSINNHISPQIINKLLKDILIGLHNLHHNIGVIHRDIKPCNIFIQNNEDYLEYNFDGEHEDLDRVFTVKIGDFGLSSKKVEKPISLVFPTLRKARTVDTNVVRAGENLIGGTPSFMAPEVTSGNYDSKVDIYSLGWTLFSLISFKSAFNPRIEKFKNINVGRKVRYQADIYKLYASDSQLHPNAKIMDLEYCKISNRGKGDNCFPIMDEINELFKIDGIYQNPFEVDEGLNYLNFFNDCISSPNNRLDSARLLIKYFGIDILREDRYRKEDPFSADDKGHYSAFG